MYGYIYRIIDTLTGKLYIGQHRYEKPEIDPSYHGSGHIIKQIYNKRPETLLEEIIFIAATEDELNYFETYFIEHLNTLHPNGYNLNTGGYSPWNRDKTGIQKSGFIGKHHTEEAKRKNSEAHKGKSPWNKGKIGVQISPKKGIFKVPYDEIYNYYIINKLTYKEIASLYNCTAKYIRNFIRKYIKKRM